MGVRTLFLCGEISSLIRAHLLRVFSLLQKQTNTNKKRLAVKSVARDRGRKGRSEVKPRVWLVDFEEGAGGVEGKGTGPRSSSRLANELLKDNPPHEQVEKESELEKRKG